MKHLFIFLFAIVFAFSLNCGDDPSAPKEEYKDAFSIYLLKDASVTTEDAVSMDLSKLELKDKPWLTVYDFDKYYLTSHIIDLYSDAYTLFGIDSMLVYKNSIGTPFVVVAKDERIYLGSFHPFDSSFRPIVPCIKSDEFNLWASDSILVRISMAALPLDGSKFVDMRYDPRIVEGLQVHDKLATGGTPGGRRRRSR